MSLIYISPICNVSSEIHYSVEIIKIRNSLFFLSSHGIRAKRENLIFWVIVFHSDLLLRRPISFSPPQPPPPSPAAAVTAAGRRRHCRRRLPGKLFSDRKTQISKRRGPIYTPVATPPETGNPRAVTRPSSPAASPSTRRRVSARVGAWILLR